MAPKDIPLDQWPDGWLKLECASLLDNPTYIIMHLHEKKDAGLPITRDEMMAFIKSKATQHG